MSATETSRVGAYTYFFKNTTYNDWKSRLGLVRWGNVSLGLISFTPESSRGLSQKTEYVLVSLLNNSWLEHEFVIFQLSYLTWDGRGWIGWLCATPHITSHWEKDAGLNGLYIRDINVIYKFVNM